MGFNRRALLTEINTVRRFRLGQWLGIDIGLSLGIILLLALGWVLIYSASGGNELLLRKQQTNLILGGLLFFASTRCPISHYRQLIPIFWLLTLLLLVAVLFTGEISKGGQRWLNLAGLRFQPSELAKLSVPLMLAYYLAGQERAIGWTKFIGCFFIIGLPALIILKQPDLGTALLVMMAGGWVLLIVGMVPSLWLSMIAGTIIALPTLWLHLYDYQRYRILMLFHPESDPFGAGYNIIQSKIAVGAGGLLGKGWCLGTQARLKYLPEAFTDFIFAVLGEEFGWLGCCLLLVVVLFITYRGLQIAERLTDAFDRLAVAALVLMFFEAVFINIGMVTGILPVVGVPLPMISYGGSSLLTFLISFGLIMSIQNSTRAGR